MTREEAFDSLTKTEIPEHLHGGLVRYVVSGIRPGGFLCACICLNTEEAVMRAADETTKRSIPVITTWLLTEAPEEIVGTPELMEAWILTKAKERTYAARR